MTTVRGLSGSGTRQAFRADLTLPSGRTLPATGRELTIEGLDVLRVVGGRVVESRRYYDRLALMTQLGLLPA